MKPIKKRRERPSGLTLTGLDSFFVQLLRQVPECADPGDDKLARARLFRPPVRKAEPQLRQDWEEYVHPDLQSHFQSARDTVVKDLARMKPELASGAAEAGNAGGADTTFRLQIPSKHYDAWLNALNQARLALAAKYHLDEGDLNDHERLPFVNERDFRLFQINFYGHLQERILVRLEEINP